MKVNEIKISVLTWHYYKKHLVMKYILYTYTSKHTYKHAHIHTYTLTNIHAHTHTHIYPFLPPPHTHYTLFKKQTWSILILYWNRPLWIEWY